MSAALYHGLVVHKRLRPVAHVLKYRIFMVALDLDEAASLARRSRLFGFDGPGLLSFHQRDHGDGTPGGLRAWVEHHLAACGLQAGGKLEILCMPRVLGHAFNPLTMYFCYAPDGRLQAMLYEVNNTFGQRHGYLLKVPPGDGPVTQDCAKTFHVSPFLPMDLRYRFRVKPPGRGTAVFISAADAQGTLLSASFAGSRVQWSDVALARAVLRMPLLGLHVLAGIHWQALRLWWKGLKLLPAPPAPEATVTVVP
jgi:DUF1365 family protein